MRTWARWTAKAAMFTASFVAAGAGTIGIANAGTTSGNNSIGGGNQVSVPVSIPVNVCGNAVAVLGGAFAACEGGASVSHDTGGGSSAGTSGNGSILGGNQVRVPVNVPVNVCGNAIAVAGFAAMRALSTRNDDPAAASRPFDAERDGFVIAEAAAVLILEELEHATARGARIYGEMAGYGVSSDANHVSDPDPVGVNAARAIAMALADAELEPGDVGYVNAHGTSTPAGDAAEARALGRAFGSSLPPVSSTKGATGHTLGAAGAIEAAFTVLALHHGVLPPTINQTTPDPECSVDVIPNVARDEQVDAALSNSFGFGGHNSVVAFRRR